MSKIWFYQNDIVPVEILHFHNAVWGTADIEEIQPSANILLLGSWICDFLSVKTDNCEEYALRSGFNHTEIDNCIYVHRLLNGFLGGKIVSLYMFQILMAKKHLILPKFRYVLDNATVYTVYECEDIEEFCLILMHQTLKLKQTIKKCEHCGKWFVPQNRTDEKYCLRPSPKYPDRNCRDAAKLSVTLARRHKNEAIRLLKNLRQMMYNKGESTTLFNEKNMVWKTKLINGTCTQKEYIDWLKSNYKRKYK